MSRFKELENMSKENSGVLLTSAVVAAGISKPTFMKFIKEENYERVGRGIYCSKESWQDGLYFLQQRCPNTVYSHDTALFLLDMTDQEPLKYTVTAKTGYNPSHLTRRGIKVFTIKKDLFNVGVKEVLTPFNHKVVIYGPERTLCDVVRSRNEMEVQFIKDAVIRYIQRKDKNINELMEYARHFHVEKRLYQYLEVLL